MLKNSNVDAVRRETENEILRQSHLSKTEGERVILIAIMITDSEGVLYSVLSTNHSDNIVMR